MHTFGHQNPGEVGFTVISHPSINQNPMLSVMVFDQAKKRTSQMVTNNATVVQKRQPVCPKIHMVLTNSDVVQARECMYLCIYVFMYLCIYVFMYLCIYVFMYLCIYVFMYICIYVYLYVYIYEHMNIWTYVYMYTLYTLYICSNEHMSWLI